MHRYILCKLDQAQDAAAIGAVCETSRLSASLSTTKILFNTAKTARQALVHCSSPLVLSSLDLSSALSFVSEDPRPMIDMDGKAGICIADIPGRRIECPAMRSLRILNHCQHNDSFKRWRTRYCLLPIHDRAGDQTRQAVAKDRAKQPRHD